MDSAYGDDDAGVRLPDDVILDILRRLPLRALAAARRVCHAWRAAVDDNTLLLSHFRSLFPQRDFPGIFISFHQGDDGGSSFFAPSPPRGTHDDDDEIVFRRPLFRHDWATVMDHCNGLLLLRDARRGFCCVCNPATLRCARLPPPPTWSSYDFYHDRAMFLAFDPAVSRHHEVFFFPQTKTQLCPEKEVQRPVEIQRPWDEISFEQLRSCRFFEEDEDQQFIQEKGQSEVRQHEQPRDEVLSLLVFSSQTGQWDSRNFVPGRCCTPGHLSVAMDVPRYGWQGPIWKSAEYWRGSLYMHCHNNILMILHSSSHRTYDTIQLPGIPCSDEECGRMFVFQLPTRSVVASYDQGIRYVAVNMFQLQVWTLTIELADGRLGWMLTHEANLNYYGHNIEFSSASLLFQSMTSWKTVKSSKAEVTLFEPRDDIEKYFHNEEYDESKEILSDNREEPEYSWNLDEDNFIDIDESTALLELPEYMSYRIIGLHPHKDVLFLHIDSNVMAYNISNSRMQYLGCHKSHNVNRTFPYRPCYVDTLPTWKMPRSPYTN
ncbi:unnamed protein product [Alopecurus aequalis]